MIIIILYNQVSHMGDIMVILMVRIVCDRERLSEKWRGEREREREPSCCPE